MNVSERLTLIRPWNRGERRPSQLSGALKAAGVPIALVAVVAGAVMLTVDGIALFVLATLAAAVVLHRARQPEGTLILAGDSLETVMLKGLLENGYRERTFEGPGGERFPSVLRVKTVNEAVELAATVPCAGLVLADIRQVIGPVRDLTGRPVPIRSELSQIEHQLRRLPVDLIRGDGWRDDARRRHGRTGYAASKRALDVCFAAVIGLLLLPVIAMTSLLLLVAHGRPVFVGIPSIGRDGRSFRYRLFRTVDDRDPGRLAVMRQQPASGWYRFVRQNHLDLLPGLWNVLRGDMSVIGPRPEPVARFAQRFAGLAHADCRHVVRPGLISHAQVRFRYTDAPRDTRLALEHDLYYVKHASPRLDLAILFRGVSLVAGDMVRFAVWATGKGSRTVRAAIAAPFAGSARRPQTVASIAFPRGLRERAALKATLLAGAGAGGVLLVREMRGNPEWGYWPVGFVDDDPAKIGTRVCGLPVLGATSAIPAIVRREHIDAVVVAIPSAQELAINRIAELARQTPAQVLKMPNIGDALYRRGGPMALQAIRVTDVLGREVVVADTERCRDFIAGRRVLVTGAAGSIGRDVARQVAQLGPELLIGLDINESDLFDLQQELKALDPPVAFRPLVASITHKKRIDAIFREFRPEIVFHAAAYKHVPMMEEYPQEAIWSNSIGTYETARAAAEAGVQRFVLVSTDKAVRPSSVMGATKRLAELMLRAVSDETGLSTCAVRFGNVLGSRGSVIPTFEKQIAAGGPVTITDPRMKRYFMTIPEAAALIVQAGAFGDRNVIYMLDMGEEVAIRDLAERMIRLHGLRVGTDIELIYTGLRPGEKLREELSLDFETAGLTPHPKVRILSEGPRVTSRPGTAAGVIERLAAIAEMDDRAEMRHDLLQIITEFDGAVYDAAFAAD